VPVEDAELDAAELDADELAEDEADDEAGVWANSVPGSATEATAGAMNVPATTRPMNRRRDTGRAARRSSRGLSSATETP
jgi:hypothetical protein